MNCNDMLPERSLPAKKNRVKNFSTLCADNQLLRSLSHQPPLPTTVILLFQGLISYSIATSPNNLEGSWSGFKLSLILGRCGLVRIL